LAAAINDAGQVAGNSTTGDLLPYDQPEFHAVLWDPDGTVHDLGVPPGGFVLSFATSINQGGQVTGWAAPPDDSTPNHAWLYDGVMRDVGGDLDGYGGGVNNQGQVVGHADLVAFIYSDGALRDLNSLLPAGANWLLFDAEAINDGGAIVGSGFGPNGEDRAFLLTPDPPAQVEARLAIQGSTGSVTLRNRATRDVRGPFVVLLDGLKNGSLTNRS